MRKAEFSNFFDYSRPLLFIKRDSIYTQTT